MEPQRETPAQASPLGPSPSTPALAKCNGFCWILRPRARFTVEEVVFLTVDFYKRNYIEGLFLSSGIIQSIDYTMEQLTQVAKTLRTEHDFNGYIHLKAVPGADEEATAEAGKWADRLSANVELPTQEDLDELAPAKTMQDVEGTMSDITCGIEIADEAKDFSAADAPSFTPAGQSTQMIVGDGGNLDLDVDPKLAWALRNRDQFPIDLNSAPYHRIIRAPGIGVRNAKRICKMRKHTPIRLEHLRDLRSNVKKAAPFVEVEGRNPHGYRLEDYDLRLQLADGSEQQSLFGAAAE